MRSEEPWMLAFPNPLALPIFSVSLISKGFFVQGGGDHCIQNCRKKNNEHHLKLFFLIGFQGGKNHALMCFSFPLCDAYLV